MHTPAVSGKPETTTLSLLTRDGAVTITFPAKLTTEQYGQLFNLTRGAETASDIKNLLALIGSDWNLQPIIEDA